MLSWSFVKRYRRWLVLVALCLTVAAVSGCRTLSFYSQAVRGQLDILAREEPIEDLMANPTTPERLKQRFTVLSDVRLFAEKELLLPVNGHYRKYADLGRPFVVWNVEAAPRFSMEPKSWWYPFVGSLEYRGYFSKKGAKKYGDYLKRQGYDVHIGGAIAYSTLGWFRDPVLNTFIWDSDVDLAETIFHELGHQRVFAAGDKEFNEAFAMLVGREGVRRWLRAEADDPVYHRYLERTRHEDEFAALVLRAREELEALYGDRRDEKGRTRAGRKKPALTSDELARRKEKIIEQMRQDYLALETRRNGLNLYEKWFEEPINNAKLNSVAAYHELVPGFQRLLEINHHDLKRFYEAAERLAHKSRQERHKWLRLFGENKDLQP